MSKKEDKYNKHASTRIYTASNVRHIKNLRSYVAHQILERILLNNEYIIKSSYIHYNMNISINLPEEVQLEGGISRF